MDLWYQVLSKLSSESFEVLSVLADGVGVEVTTTDGESELKQKRRLLRSLENLIDEKEDAHIKPFLFSFLQFLPDPLACDLSLLLSGVCAKKLETQETQVSDTASILKGLGIDSSTSTFRKDFRIVGIIGSSQRDHLNYISLCGQIAEGKKRGYSNEEIASAIRKSVQAGTHLRTYLDSKIDLPLEKVLSFIRSYLKEKSATELFQDLNNTVQMESEDVQSFVLRAMELREKIAISSAAEGSIAYDAKCVESLFFHTVRTGMADDAVKARLDPFLRKGVSTPDDILIQEVNAAASEEAERRKKRGAVELRRKARVAEATVAEKFVPGSGKKLDEPLNPMLEQVKEMTREMKLLREEVNALKATSKPFEPGCDFCKRKGNQRSCRHCWACGAGDHVMQSCPNKNSSLN